MAIPCPKPVPKQKAAPKRLRAKNKNSTPKKVLKEVEERDNGLCRVCLRLYRDPHHIIKRSQASKEWVHDPRNIECLCGECHGKTENDHKFRLSRERQAVIDFGWLNGRAMTLSEWEIWRNWK